MTTERDSDTGTPQASPADQEAQQNAKRGKKACTECRQQKVRCNVSIDPPKDCDRCVKLKLQCFISDPFKRTHKRNRLSELENEAARLRRRLGGVDSGLLYDTVAPVMTPSARNLAPVRSPQLTGVQEPGVDEPRVEPTIDYSTIGNITDNGEGNGRPTYSGPTLPRSLEGVKVGAADIDALFQIFFEKFSPFLPILDPQAPPNEFYARSPFLFWTIVAVSSGVYAKDPTILQAICPKIIDLSLSSLKSRAASLHAIQGLLILITWPLPRNLHGTDANFPLGGAMIHMAMQIGLHIPLSTQDFSRVKIRLSQEEISKRAELWLHCVIVYNRACNLSGLTPIVLHDTPHAFELEEKRSLVGGISRSVRLNLKMLRTIIRCYGALTENGLRSVTDQRARTMDIILRIFEAEIHDFASAVTSRIDDFYVHVSLLNIQIFHLYKDPADQKPQDLTKLFNSACTVLRDLETLDAEAQVLETAPYYFLYASMLASFSLLRLLKSSFTQYIDFEEAKSVFFLGVNLGKRLSHENNDSAARLSSIMRSLWNSPMAFKNSDGTECMSLRIRTRLAMSPVYDAIWWYKEEFQAFKGAYQSDPDERSEGQPQAMPTPAASTPAVTWPSFEPQDTFGIFDDQLLAELSWTLGDETNLGSFALSSDPLAWNPGQDLAGVAFPPQLQP